MTRVGERMARRKQRGRGESLARLKRQRLSECVTAIHALLKRQNVKKILAVSLTLSTDSRREVLGLLLRKLAGWELVRAESYIDTQTGSGSPMGNPRYIVELRAYCGNDTALAMQ